MGVDLLLPPQDGYYQISELPHRITGLHNNINNVL